LSEVCLELVRGHNPNLDIPIPFNIVENCRDHRLTRLTNSDLSPKRGSELLACGFTKTLVRSMACRPLMREINETHNAVSRYQIPQPMNTFEPSHRVDLLELLNPKIESNVFHPLLIGRQLRPPPPSWEEISKRRTYSRPIPSDSAITGAATVADLISHV